MQANLQLARPGGARAMPGRCYDPGVQKGVRRWQGYRARLFAGVFLFGLAATPAAASEPPTERPTPVGTTSDATLAEQVGAPKNESPHGVRRHYMWSNERRHDLFFVDLAELGGGYLGVGGDQNYTLAAAAGTQVLWLVDLDVAVVRMHRLYAALLTVAETPEEFVALLLPKHQPQVYEAVAAYHQAAPEAERKAILAVYHAYRDDLHQHLRATAAARWAGKPSTWLAEPTMYSHLQKLARARLIVPRLGDLTGPSTLQEIAQAARTAGIPVHVLYLSNAESWFSYGREFRRNLAALPFDERSVVLRTVKSEVLAYPRGDIWHYSVQRGDHFAQRLAGRDYAAIDATMDDAEPTARGLSHIGFPPPGPAAAASDDPSAARRRRQQERELRARREQLLASGLVTRPEGNREHAREMDRERLKRVGKELDPAAAAASRAE